MDKFVEYQRSPDNVQEFSNYVHLNFRLIWTKMLSEMRRKLDIKPDMQNTEGYVSLMVSIQGRLFNEMVYGLAGTCQSCEMNVKEIIPPDTQRIIMQLFNGENPLNGNVRTDIVSKEEFEKYYLSFIDELRKNTDALPQ